MLRFNDYGDLPPFASSSNKVLDKQVRAKEVKLSLITNEVHDQSQRTQALERHLLNVRQQLSHAQSLVEARHREINTEDHLKIVAKQELGRYALDIKRIKIESSNLSDQSAATQTHIFRASEKIAKLKTLCRSEEQELGDWLKVQQEKDEDNLILLKYSKEDESRSKELTIQLEKLGKEVIAKRNQLNQMVLAFEWILWDKVSQVEVEKIGDEFRALHQERQTLLSQWESAITEMRKRDQQIDVAQSEYETLKDNIRAKKSLVRDQQDILDTQLDRKSDIERNIEALDRHLAKLRIDQINSKQSLSSYQDELDALRTHLNRTSNDVRNNRNEIQRLQEQIISRNDQKEAEDQRLVSLQQKLSTLLDKTGSKQDRAEKLAEFLRQDENRCKNLDKQIKQLKESAFSHTQDLHKLKQNEKTLIAEIAGAHSVIRNMVSKTVKLDQESVAQRSLLYNLEFTLQQLERKIKRAQGDRTEEEQTILKEKINSLTEQYDTATEQHALLNSQLRRAQDDLRLAKRRVQVLEKEKSGLDEQIDGLNLYITSATSQLSAKVRDKEDVMVEAAVLKLEVKKLDEFMYVRADQVLALQSRHVQLQLALEERTQEIHLHKQMLQSQIRAAEEERHATASELRDRSHKLQMMKTRYEILMGQIGVGCGNDLAGDNEGNIELDDSPGKSQAFYIIQAAQQRETLQRQGDAMDSKIQATEREIKTMENTLDLLNNKNNSFKSHLSTVDVNPHDLEHKAYLQTQLDSALASLKQKQATLNKLQQELSAAEQQLTVISENEAREQMVIAQLQSQHALLIKQVADALMKKKRAETLVSKLIREIRKSRNVTGNQALEEELDMAARDAKDAGNFTLHKVNEVLDRFLASQPTALVPGSIDTKPTPGVHVLDYYNNLLDQLDIRPPSRPATRISNHVSGISSSLNNSPRASPSRFASPSFNARNSFQSSVNPGTSTVLSAPGSPILVSPKNLVLDNTRTPKSPLLRTSSTASFNGHAKTRRPSISARMSPTSPIQDISLTLSAKGFPGIPNFSQNAHASSSANSRSSSRPVSRLGQ